MHDYLAENAGLVDRIARDERKMENEMKDLLKMDTRKLVMDRMLAAMERFEAYVHKTQSDPILGTEGRWRAVHTRSAANFVMQDIYLFYLRERVKTRFK